MLGKRRRGPIEPLYQRRYLPLNASAMNPILLFLLISFFCSSIAGSMAAESPVPSRVLVGTESASRAHFKAINVLSPRVFQGEYAVEGGDGVTIVRVVVSPVANRPDSWSLTGKIEERVAGRKPIRKSMKAARLRKDGGFWVFQAGRSRGVFASYHGESAKGGHAEPGLILDGFFLFQTKR